LDFSDSSLPGINGVILESYEAEMEKQRNQRKELEKLRGKGVKVSREVRAS
jgi:hypothetical protein